MITFVFLFFIAFFAVAGVVISISSKKNRGVTAPRREGARSTAAVGRANREED